MNDLIEVILSLNNDESDEFIAFAKAKNQRSDVKNIQLFKLLKSGIKKDLDLKIYGKPNRNALHALKSRLKDSLVDFTASRSLNNDTQEDLQLLKLLLAARIFLEKQQLSIGFKILRKAIKTAESLELYAILQECYHTYVQYAHLDPTTNLDDLIAAYDHNQSLYETETKLVKAYAVLNRELAQHPPDVFEVIKGKLRKYDLKIDANLSFKSLFQIMNIVTDAANLKSDYASVALFMDHVFNIVTTKKHLAEKNVYYHCEILYLMSGTHFRNKNFQKSQAILTGLEDQLSKQKGTSSDHFKKRIALLKALNFNYTGQPSKAIALLDNFNKPTARIELAHAMFLFQHSDFQKARRAINELKHTDTFYEKKEGLLLVLQKNILEILIYMELNQPDLVESKMRSFKKRYRKKLLDLDEGRVLKFMSLLRSYFEEPFLVTEPSFKSKVEKAFIWKTAENEDIFVMSFYAYLKSKMEKTSIYKATLELVDQTTPNFIEK